MIAALAAAALLAQGLGQIEFPASGAPSAQQPFLRGVLLLHSFEYDDAREEFLAAQKIDPKFAMAYWGEAMTYLPDPRDIECQAVVYRHSHSARLNLLEP